jgi:MHS family proline/betaine transporter-like MFS transporter
VTQTSSKRAIAAGAIGNFCEVYDFAVFGFSVPFVAAHFFPTTDATAAIMSTFAVFAVAFVARPVGGLVFGYLGDKLGRIKMLSWTIWLMAIATACIGLIPTYGSIGIWAPVLLVVCRLLQGFAFGGETTGSTSFVLESAVRGQRGRAVSIIWFFANLPNAAVALMLLGLQLVVGKEAFVDWVWRIPFLAGGLIGIVGYWLRRNLDDPDEYKEAARTAKYENPLRTVARYGWKPILQVAMILPVQTVGAYLLLGFMYTFLVKQLGFASTTALFVNAAAIIVYAAGYIVGGILSDRFGRKKILTAAAVWVAVLAYPAISLISGATLADALIGQALIALGVGTYSGACFTAAAEFFPTAYRATGHAIAYQCTVAVLGGTTPLVSAWLVTVLGTPTAPAYYLALIGVVCVILIQFVPETKDVAQRTSSGDAAPASSAVAAVR